MENLVGRRLVGTTMRKTLTLLVLFLVVACLPAGVSLVRVGLAIMREPRFDVVTRETSPDGLLDAVHVMPRTGVTGGFAHWVYITAAGGSVVDVGPDEPVFVADQAPTGINIAWTKNAELSISAHVARVFKSKGATTRLPNGEARQIAVRLDNR
jgi:hypothetical protein